MAHVPLRDDYRAQLHDKFGSIPENVDMIARLYQDASSDQLEHGFYLYIGDLTVCFYSKRVEVRFIERRAHSWAPLDSERAMRALEEADLDYLRSEVNRERAKLNLPLES